jgi:general secretion pathway protein K
MRGTALIAALIVVFLATAAAVAMAERELFDLRRDENLLRLSQGMQALQGVEAWAVGELRREASATATGRADVQLSWALPPTKIAGGVVSGTILDAGHCFNVNNIVNSGARSEPDMLRFQRLLRVLAIDPGVADAVLDWIDADLNTTVPGGAEDDYYTRQDPPYRSANRPIASVSELLKVKGMTPEFLARLQPHLCALPQRTMINVNAADAEVIMSLADGVGRSAAEGIIAGRATHPFLQPTEFIQQLGVPPASVASDNLAVTSDYVEAIGQVKLGDIRLQSHTLIARHGDHGVTIVARRLGEEADAVEDANEEAKDGEGKAQDGARL